MMRNERPGWRGGLAALMLVAYVVVLGSSPLEHGWDLAVHLARDHHATSQFVPSERSEDGSRQHAMFADADASVFELLAASSKSHEHDGKAHTHDQRPTEQSFLLTITLSKFFLFSAALLPTPPPAKERCVMCSVAVRDQLTLPIEVPPPRLLG